MVFSKVALVVAGTVTKVIGVISFAFVVIISVVRVVVLLLGKNSVVSGKNVVVLGAMEFFIVVGVLISSIFLLVLGVEDALS